MEAAFTVCTFWLVEALALIGRTDEARELFDQLLEPRQRARPLLRGHPPGHARAERQLPADVQPRRADQRRVPALAALGLTLRTCQVSDAVSTAASNRSILLEAAAVGIVGRSARTRRSHTHGPQPRWLLHDRARQARLDRPRRRLRRVGLDVLRDQDRGRDDPAAPRGRARASSSRRCCSRRSWPGAARRSGSRARARRERDRGRPAARARRRRLVHVAETRIDSSVAAMIAGTVPLQIIVLRLLAGENPARATRLSTLAGLVRARSSSSRRGSAAGSTALGLAVMISATMSWTLGSFLSKRLPLPANPFVATVWEMAFGGAFLLVGALAVRGVRPARLRHVRPRLAPRVGLPRRHGLARRLLRVRVAPARRADLARRDAPVREPARRDRARHGVPRRAAEPVDARAAPRS